MELWGQVKGILVSNLGNSKSPITIHQGHRTIRKRVTIDGKSVQKRYQVARLVLELFPPEMAYQDEGLGNHEGKGTVVWEDGNELNDRADNLRWKWNGPGWTEALMADRGILVQKAIEALKLTEDMSEFYESVKEKNAARKK